MKKQLFLRLAVVQLAALAAAGSAQATLSDEITTAVTAAGVTLNEAATAVIVMMLGFWTLRKVGQKLGWW